MTTRTLDCTECGASVAYGRLSCPECGALLASLAGATAPATRQSAPPAPAPAPDLPVSDPPTVAPAGPTVVGPTVAVAASSIPSVLRDSANVVRAPAFVPATAGGAPVWPADATGVGPTSQGRPKTPLRPPSTTIGPSSMEAARVGEVAGWFIIVGAAMSVVGFLLPWSRVVIGAGSYGGYLSTWGLASPNHLFVFLVIVGMLAVAILRPSRVPTWLAFGVGGLGLGGLLLGLAWPYLVGPLGAQLGVLLVGLGGLALAIGGALTVWSSRHDEDGPVV